MRLMYAWDMSFRFCEMNVIYDERLRRTYKLLEWNLLCSRWLYFQCFVLKVNSRFRKAMEVAQAT
jgi:hypothetical protein